MHLRSSETLQFIEAIAHRCYCVSFRWILECLRYDRLVDENPYEIDGIDTEVSPCGGPQRARLTDKQHYLFSNCCFMIKYLDTNNGSISNRRLTRLILVCGGRIIDRVTEKILQSSEIFIICDRLYVSEQRNNYDQCRSFGINFVSSDWIVKSILAFRRIPFLSFAQTPL
jgi:hypothetical protein